MSDDGIARLDPFISKAMERFKRAQDWESNYRKRFLEDIKFANADADNMWSWPQKIRQNRDLEERPCLVINKIRQHNILITNDLKENKAQTKIVPTGGGATFESATAKNAIIRRIWQKSNADAAVDTACEFMVQAGCGFVRVVNEYQNEESFNQEPKILRIPDPMAVFIDPDAKAADKSDMNWAFVFVDQSRELFEEQHPGIKNPPVETMGYGWYNDQYVREAEYFWVEEIDDTLVKLPIGTVKLLSELGKGFDTSKMLTRPTKRREVWWCKIAGYKVVEGPTEFPSKYIPIVPFVAEETIIDGDMDRKGHTRAMKDPQRIYQFWASAAVEYGALQTKTPWLAAIESIEQYQDIYNTSNRVNYAVLPYNALDDNGQDLPPPQKIPPPVAAPVALQGMEIAQNEMMMVSGQYAPQFGEQGSERTGDAINARTHMGAKATYHYVNAQAIGIRALGVILLDMIPRLYDVDQVLNVLAEDGTDFELVLDPSAQQVYQQKLDHNNDIAERVLNPLKGEYDVVVDVGPSYATRRQEAFNAFTLILTQAPQLAQVLGDILFRAGDFPMADEAAMRLKRMVPLQALGKGPTQTEQQLQEQLKEVTEKLQQSAEELSIVKVKMHNHSDQAAIGSYKAITERMRVLAESDMDDHTKVIEMQRLMIEAAVAFKKDGENAKSE